MGMDLYLRFMASLALGLLGLGLVMKISIERLFSEWDAFADLKAFIIRLYHGHGFLTTMRTEDVLLEAEKGKEQVVSTRLVDARRQELQEIDRVENQLAQPAAPAPALASGRSPGWVNPAYDNGWGS